MCFHFLFVTVLTCTSSIVTWGNKPVIMSHTFPHPIISSNVFLWSAVHLKESLKYEFNFLALILFFSFLLPEMSTSHTIQFLSLVLLFLFSISRTNLLNIGCVKVIGNKKYFDIFHLSSFIVHACPVDSYTVCKIRELKFSQHYFRRLLSFDYRIPNDNFMKFNLLPHAAKTTGWNQISSLNIYQVTYQGTLQQH